jgi:hypothetical protein
LPSVGAVDPVRDLKISALILDGDAVTADHQVDVSGTNPEVVEFDPLEPVR